MSDTAKRSYEQYEIISVEPVPGEWEACFRQKDGTVDAVGVAAWAIIRVRFYELTGYVRKETDKPERRLEPLVLDDEPGGLEPACACSNYLGVRRKEAAT